MVANVHPWVRSCRNTFHTCGVAVSATYPRRYSPAQLRAGHLTGDQAAGRLFCTVTNGQLSLLWTDNNGMLLAELTGFPHLDAYKWWRYLHHNLEVVPMSGMQNGH